MITDDYIHETALLVRISGTTRTYFIFINGGGGIRTHEGLLTALTRFRVERLRPAQPPLHVFFPASLICLIVLFLLWFRRDAGLRFPYFSPASLICLIVLFLLWFGRDAGLHSNRIRYKFSSSPTRNRTKIKGLGNLCTIHCAIGPLRLNIISDAYNNGKVMLPDLLIVTIGNNNDNAIRMTIRRAIDILTILVTFGFITLIGREKWSCESIPAAK